MAQTSSCSAPNRRDRAAAVRLQLQLDFFVSQRLIALLAYELPEQDLQLGLAAAISGEKQRGLAGSAARSA